MDSFLFDLAESVNVDVIGMRESPSNFLNGLTKIDERVKSRSGDPAIIEQYAIAHCGEIGQHFIPIEAFLKNCFAEECTADFLSLAYGWRYGGIQMEFDLNIFEQVLLGDVLTEIPRSWIDKIPGWAVSFSVCYRAKDIGIQEKTYVFGRRMFKGKDCLTMMIFGKRIEGETFEIVDVGDGFVSLRVAETGTPANEKTLRIVGATMFTFSLIPHNPTPVKLRQLTGKKRIANYHIEPKSKPTVLSTVKAQSEYLEEFDTDTEKRTQGSRCAHMRRAHWRTYWLGPRDGNQTKILKWIPPTFVNGSKCK